MNIKEISQQLKDNEQELIDQVPEAPYRSIKVYGDGISVKEDYYTLEEGEAVLLWLAKLYGYDLVPTTNVEKEEEKEDEVAADFQGTKYVCQVCGDIISSSCPGEFVSCKCGDSFVDESRYYCRLGGMVKLLEEDDK